MINKENLIALGYGPYWQDLLSERDESSYKLARVVAVHKESYLISQGEGEAFAELSGKVLYTADSVLQLPTVGDWVFADFYDEEHAIIHELIPRRTLLKRKTPGKSIDFQLIASNINTAFVVQSLDDNFNVRRLERYLVMIHDAGIRPVILLSKCDLMSADRLQSKLLEIKEIYPDITLVHLSAESGVNIDTLAALLMPGDTYCFVGSSGVGKTTLVNHLLGSESFVTKPVSKKENKGRHTTTHRHLVRLQEGALLIDTPGMRELGTISVETGIEEAFADIERLSLSCKYNGCQHIDERGCSVRSAIDTDVLSKDRYKNFISMKKESDFNNLSYLDKKKKDKHLGKTIKSVIKNKKNNR